MQKIPIVPLIAAVLLLHCRVGAKRGKNVAARDTGRIIAISFKWGNRAPLIRNAIRALAAMPLELRAVVP